MELKPPTTIDQQIKILSERGVIIDDYDLAKTFLERTNYYRVSSYLLTFRNVDGETYRPVNFSSIVKLYEFDQALRSVIFKAIEDIEVELRSFLAYYNAHHHGAEGYMNPENYNDGHEHDRFSAQIDKCIKDNRNTPVIMHHDDKYDGHYPIWAIIEFFSFGTLSYFYRGMLNPEKTEISFTLYGVTYQIMQSWLRCVNTLRNRCAHYSRLYYWKFAALPKMPNGDSFEVEQRLFTQLYVLRKMHPNAERWNGIIDEIEVLIQDYADYIQLACIGFPEDWHNILKVE